MLYCGGRRVHVKCPDNPISVNYVGNRNNLYSNTYNTGWRNHLNFSWSNRRSAQEEKPINPLGFPPMPSQVSKESLFGIIGERLFSQDKFLHG